MSEHGDIPKLQNKLDPSIKYIFTKNLTKREISDFNPGRVRNDGVNISHGEYVYTNDADVLFMNPLFLWNCKRLLEKDEKLSLFRPRMRRLPIENFEIFKKRFEVQGIQNVLDSLHKDNEFLATTDRNTRNLKVFFKNSEDYLKVFTTSIENFEKYVKDDKLKGKEPLIWSENLHCGGNFFRRRHFDKVGGYCVKFINWGCEDSDLQWKLKEIFNLQFFPKIEEFTVLHLDHTKEYFVKENWKKNEQLYALRKKKGILYAIKEDLKNA